MQLHVRVRETNGRCGGERDGITYKVKHPGTDFCPCFQGAERSLETDPVFFCINSVEITSTHTHTDEHTQVHTHTKKKKLVMAHLCFRLSGVQLKIRASICPKVSSEQAHNDR